MLVTSSHQDHVALKKCYNFLSVRAMILQFEQNNYKETPIKLRVTWTVTMTGSNPYSHLTLWSCILTRSLDKLKAYFHFQNAYAHQTWQDGNLPWGAPIHKITWHFDHVVLKVHVTNREHFIPTTTVPIATKRGSVVTYHEIHSNIPKKGLLTVLLLMCLSKWCNKYTPKR